jgi:ABC-three component (ABC-3C) system Middle Component 3
MMSGMTEWSARSMVPAALLNPAMLAGVVAASAAGYEREGQVPMPWPLSFIIAPLTLHRGTREAMPSTVATHLGVWVSRNPILRAGMPLRARALVEPVREGLRFGLRHGLLTVEASGALRQGIPRLRAPDAGDLREVLRKATFAGRWVSHIEEPGTVFALFGVTV